jgi:hypothetical protein
MQIGWRARLTPTAVGTVSRAWVMREVAGRVADESHRTRLVDELVGFEPPRRHGLRNNFIFWIGVLTAAALARLVGLPGWTGFVAALLGFLWVAHELAVRALRWRLDQLLAGEEAEKDTRQA